MGAREAHMASSQLDKLQICVSSLFSGERQRTALCCARRCREGCRSLATVRPRAQYMGTCIRRQAWKLQKRSMKIAISLSVWQTTSSSHRIGPELCVVKGLTCSHHFSNRQINANPHSRQQICIYDATIAFCLLKCCVLVVQQPECHGPMCVTPIQAAHKFPIGPNMGKIRTHGRAPPRQKTIWALIWAPEPKIRAHIRTPFNTSTGSCSSPFTLVQRSVDYMHHSSRLKRAWQRQLVARRLQLTRRVPCASAQAKPT
jgi:hypothetical protein